MVRDSERVLVFKRQWPHSRCNNNNRRTRRAGDRASTMRHGRPPRIRRRYGRGGGTVYRLAELVTVVKKGGVSMRGISRFGSQNRLKLVFLVFLSILHHRCVG